jgi:hypothetical protein
MYAAIDRYNPLPVHLAFIFRGLEPELLREALEVALGLASLPSHTGKAANRFFLSVNPNLASDTGYSVR